MQKKWSKTAFCGLSSGQTILPQPIWGHGLQLDDRYHQYQRDHLVGQSTNNGEDHGDGDGGGDYHQPGRSLITAIAEHQDLRATVVNRPG